MTTETQNGSKAHLRDELARVELMIKAEMDRLETLRKESELAIPVYDVTDLDDPEDDEPQPETDRTAWYIVNRLAPFLLPVAFVGLTIWGLSSLPEDNRPTDPGLSCFGTGDARCGPAEPYQAPRGEFGNGLGVLKD